MNPEINDREYIQDESETVDLVIYEEYLRWGIEEDWEDWVNRVGYTD